VQVVIVLYWGEEIKQENQAAAAYVYGRGIVLKLDSSNDAAHFRKGVKDYRPPKNY
jgi:hypothetical protein